jgi:outer membrane protein assembly factor BamB
LLLGGALAAAATAGGVVLAIRTPTRPVRWTTSADRGAAAVAAYGSDVYMVDKFGLVHAFDPADGAVLWTFQVPGSVPVAGPILHAASGTCYVETPDAGLCALDAASGQPRWIDDAAGTTQCLAAGGLLIRAETETVTTGVMDTEVDGVIGPIRIPINEPFCKHQGPRSGLRNHEMELPPRQG